MEAKQVQQVLIVFVTFFLNKISSVQTADFIQSLKYSVTDAYVVNGNCEIKNTTFSTVTNLNIRILC